MPPRRCTALAIAANASAAGLPATALSGVVRGDLGATGPGAGIVGSVCRTVVGALGGAVGACAASGLAMSNDAVNSERKRSSGIGVQWRGS